MPTKIMMQLISQGKNLIIYRFDRSLRQMHSTKALKESSKVLGKITIKDEKTGEKIEKTGYIQAEVTIKENFDDLPTSQPSIFSEQFWKEAGEGWHEDRKKALIERQLLRPHKRIKAETARVSKWVGDWRVLSALLAVCGFIYNTAKGIREQIEESQDKTDKKIDEIEKKLVKNVSIFNLADPVSYYIRTRSLQQLEQIVISGREDIIKIINIVGRSGIGKSQLIRKYAQDYAKRQRKNSMLTTIFVLRENELQNDYLQLANSLNVDGSSEQIITLTNNKLKERNNWILIFENVTAYETIKQYIPTEKSHGIILISSNHSILPTGLGDKIQLEGLTTGEAVILLEKISNRRHEQVLCRQLVKDLNYLPLAIVRAGAYLNVNSQITVSAYREQLNFKYKENYDKNSSSYKENLIYDAVLELSTDKLDKATLHLIQTIALLAPQPIPITILQTSTSASSDVKEEPEVMLQRLREYLLIEEQSIFNEHLLVGNQYMDTINIHSIIQNSIKTKIQTLDVENIIPSIFGMFEEHFILDNRTERNVFLNTLLYPHVKNIVELAYSKREKLNLENKINLARYLYITGNYLIRSNQIQKFHQARNYLENAKELCELMNNDLFQKNANEICLQLVEIDPRLPSIYANTLHYLAKTYYKTMPDENRKKQSSFLLEKAWKIRKAIDDFVADKKLNLVDIDNAEGHATIVFQRMLALNYLIIGKQKDAIPLLEDIKHEWDKFNYVICHLNLAKAYHTLSKQTVSKKENYAFFYQTKNNEFYSKAIENINAAIEEIEKNPIAFRDQGAYYIEQGKLYLDKKNPLRDIDKGIASFLKAKNIKQNKAVLANASEGLANAYQMQWKVAKRLDTLANLDRLEKALEEAKQCLFIRSTIFSDTDKSYIRAKNLCTLIETKIDKEKEEVIIAYRMQFFLI